MTDSVSFSLLISLLILVAYLIGSIPTSVWVGRWFYQIDVREHGSGNAGATNTFRVLGVKAGVPVLIFDIFKGWLAVQLFYFASDYFFLSKDAEINLQLSLGIAALLGHIFPIYVGFKGGKGVATLLGAVIGIHIFAALIAIGIFIVMLFLTRYVSLSSMVAGLSFPILIVAVYHTTTISLVVFSMLVAVLLLFTHQKNIERLISKNESKVKFKKSKRKNAMDLDS